MKPHNRAIAFTPLIPDDTQWDLPSFDTGPAERASRIPLAMSTGTSTIENRSLISMAPIKAVLTLASLAINEQMGSGIGLCMSVSVSRVGVGS